MFGLHTFEGFPDFPLGDVERLCLVRGLLPSPVGPRARLNNAAPSVQPHYRAFIPTTSCSAPVLRFGTLVLAVGAAWTSPLASERQVLTFRTRAWLSFAPSTCRMPLEQASGFSRAGPGGRDTPRFRHRLIRFRHFINGSTMRFRPYGFARLAEAQARKGEYGAALAAAREGLEAQEDAPTGKAPSCHGARGKRSFPILRGCSGPRCQERSSRTRQGRRRCGQDQCETPGDPGLARS